MRNLRIGAIALSTCLTVYLSSCAAMSAWANLQPPQVELERIQVKSVGVTGGVFDVTLRVKNPNPVTLDGTGLTTTIDVKGSRFAQVDLSNAFSLPKGEAVSLVVPVLVSWSGAGAVARELLNTGSVPYQLGGRVTVNTPIGAKGLDFHGSGTVQVVK
jgi:LEA14-like dessication related protein